MESLMKYSWIHVATVSAVLLLTGFLVNLIQGDTHKDKLIDAPLVIHVPFVFSPQLDPRAISTVGDQMVSEHVFAFHARESQTQGFGFVFSDVQINNESSEVVLKLRHTVKSSDGTSWSSERICASIRASLEGTAHAPIGDLVRDVRCETERTIRVQFSKLPVNIRYLFTLSDFSIFDPAQLPLSKSYLPPGNGPYRIKDYDTHQVSLEANPYYPPSLRANSEKLVVIKSYPAAEARAILKSAIASSKDPFLGYFYGYALSDQGTT